MGKNLFVAGLDYSITDDQLQELFSAHGTVVSAKVIMDREMGRSKGFGFVEMGSPEEAMAAITAINETEVQGRTIMVKEARPREEGSGSGGGNRFGNNKFKNDSRGGGRNDRRGGGRNDKFSNRDNGRSW